MESLTELDQTSAKPNDSPVIYRAVGWVAGTFQPGANKFQHGVLVTQDGHKISASLDWYLHHQLKKKQKEVVLQKDFMNRKLLGKEVFYVGTPKSWWMKEICFITSPFSST